MPVFRSIEELNKQFPYPVLTIGNFDGVHLGHRALFQLVNQRAQKAQGTSMVMTFTPHPLRVLTHKPQPPLITMDDQKLELVQAAGIEVVICLHFTKELAAVEPEDFVKDYLVDRIGVRELVIGYDYTFGRKARGNRDMLTRLGEEFGFSVHAVGALPAPGGHIASSTLVRELVQAGRVEMAPEILGRYYRISGRVVRGHNRGGALLGFPTANLKLVDELVPKEGVYAVKVTHKQKQYDGVANIGDNPTFDDKVISVEVHCFDFHEDIYDQDIKVDFVARIRDEVKFSGPDHLKTQICMDCDAARRILGAQPASPEN